MFKLFHTPIKTPLKTRILVLAVLWPAPPRRRQAAPDPLRLRPERGKRAGPRHLAQELEKISGGKLKMKTFGSANLGSDEQMQGALAAPRK